MDRWLGELALACRESGVHRGEVGACLAHHIERRALVAERVLRQQRQPEPAAACHRSGVSLLEPCRDPQECRLPRPVAADQPDARSVLHLERRAIEDAASAEALRDLAQAEEGHGR